MRHDHSHKQGYLPATRLRYSVGTQHSSIYPRLGRQKDFRSGGVHLAACGREALPRTALSGNVLVVDDEEVVGEFMCDLLESWGLQVTVALGAAQACDMFARDAARFDLVITDQTMPRMTGMELARELLALRGDLPIILYTGFSDGILPQDMRAAGVRALVTKPVDPHVLVGLLRAHLPRR